MNEIKQRKNELKVIKNKLKNELKINTK